MRERVQQYFTQFQNALRNLEEAVQYAKTDIEIDGTIKRFELCYELSWKLIKEYLADLGLICKNPRDCFRLAYQNGLIANDQIWMEMIDARNRLVRTYSAEESREMFIDIKEKFLHELKYLYDKILNAGQI
ncbi:HI0074 family nucleotidyltransferase substrate-binding subunit [Pseudothermotoga thermarum]|nr:HI0074 family nucleotidyltransferase substrate-binding subunit [Pseudothermotoga thermarum]